MRMAKWLVIPVLSGVILSSACWHGYRTTSIGVHAEFGPVIELWGYSARHFGDWRVYYRQWTPIIIYELDGHYYSRKVHGGRPVQVYRSPSGYFLPPRDIDWTRTDKRFKEKQRPTDEDYNRARPRPNS